MEAPLCRLCAKRHYGTCADPVIARQPRARKQRVRTTKHQPGLVQAPVKTYRDDGLEDDPALTEGAKNEICNHGKQLGDIYAFCLLADGHAGDHEYVSSSSDADVCPSCGTNLAAKRKERDRRRQYMQRRRAEK